MINNKRSVPITKVDWLTAVSVMCAIANVSVTKLDPATVDGQFSQTTNSATAIASQPVKSFDFATGVTAGTVYFVAASDYEGFTLAGAAATTAGATVNADGATLYKAVLASGTITISQVGL